MDEYEKELMRKNLEVSQESLKLLKKMHRARMVGGTLKVFKWMIIIGISLGSYYYVEPYLRPMIDAVGGITSGAERVQGVGEAANPNNPSPDFIEKLRGLLLR
ncbi:MAG: hypothetical protein GXP44_00080 [bacterium]|nr:hypothetical protein [bacterium]